MKLRMDISLFLIVLLVFAPVSSSNIEQTNIKIPDLIEFFIPQSVATKEIKEVRIPRTSGGGGSSRSPITETVHFKGRDIPMIHLGIGSQHMFYARYLAGLDNHDPAKARIKSIKISNPGIVDVRSEEDFIILTGRSPGQTTVTAHVYNSKYNNIWVSTDIPVTVTQSVYGIS